ncbi:hypothetical protein QTL95_17600 [Rhizobium sp. S152]|uniref:DUF6894 family protein n=1 Tax=Rhizobium sp. S152 TaxID=3055038 RepID=UPI0025A975FD|nr:hypothetical protein [Rhizobium sp. S152]MDM9627716.1 hypothetical protein [Rhizobium sp. S152]
MRFYFHVRSERGYDDDKEGIELASLEAAKREAEASAREMVAELVKQQERIDGTRFEIADEQGRVLAVLPFLDVVKLG